MGFTVDPFERPTSQRTAGRDYTPPADDGYKPVINLHLNHSNLEGRYDPRAHIDENGPHELDVDPRARRVGRWLTLILLVCVVLLVGLYLMSGTH
ncbi:MAG: hypothetical protein ABIQ44_07370 [Chloroflexia bacterium]